MSHDIDPLSFDDMHDRDIPDLVDCAREKNNLSLRSAGEVTGLTFHRLAHGELARRTTNTRTNEKLAKLGIPHEMLELRAGRLPVGAGHEFQNMVYDLWQRYRKALAGNDDDRPGSSPT